MPRSSWNTGTLVEGQKVRNFWDDDEIALDPIAAVQAEDDGEDTYDGPFGDREFDVFAEAVAEIESGGQYDIEGGYNNHYQGKYQFGRTALKDVGIGFTPEEREAFRNDPNLQETAFQSFTHQNHKTLLRYSKKYRQLNQRQQLGILALAHNAGAGGALEFLRSGKDTTDGFGTKGTRYVNAVAKAFNQGGAAA